MILAMGTGLMMAQYGPVAPPPSQPEPVSDTQQHPWTFGGSVGFTGGSGGRFGVSVSPRVGYLVTPELELGVKGTYAWVRSDWFTSNQFGIGPFANYYVDQRFFLGAQFQQNFISQKLRDGSATYTASEPALFLGAGYLMRMGGSASLQLAVMYNVFYKENSNFYSSGLVPSVGVVFGL